MYWSAERSPDSESSPMPRKKIKKIVQFTEVGVLSLLILITGSAYCESEQIKPMLTPLPARQLELLKLVRQECGSCHGLYMSGGLGSPLTPEAIKEKPTAMLTDIILFGRKGTAMPPWESFLTRTEAEWIIQKLLKGLP